MMTINTDELKRRTDLGDRLLLVDVRSATEYASGHIPGAVNIPMDQVEARLADIRADVQVALICQSGKRASMTCELLNPHHENLVVLEGGTSAWQQAGLPVVRTTSTRWSLDRQVRLIAGLIVLTGTVLSVLVNPAWVYLAMFIGAGLTFAGITNLCGMASLLALMPWNKPTASKDGSRSDTACTAR